MTIGLVQHILGSDGSSGSITSKSLTLTSVVGSGNAVVGGFCWDNSSGCTISTIQDNKSNSYTFYNDSDDAANTAVTTTFHLENITNGPQTITITWTGGSTAFVRIMAAEFSGVATTSALDGHTGQVNAGSTATNGQTSGNITTTANGDLIYSIYQDTAGAGGAISYGTSPAFTGLDKANGTDNDVIGHEYFIQSSAGSVDGTWTQTAASKNGVNVLALKAAVSGDTFANNGSLIFI